MCKNIYTRRHIMEGAENLPDGTEFYGEIFLGLVKYEIETVIEER